MAACRGDEKISRRGVLGGMLWELECGNEGIEGIAKDFGAERNAGVGRK